MRKDNIMKKAYYFSHDTNAHRDERILAMRVDYGWEGYGWYWAIIETMAEASNYKLKYKDSNSEVISMAGLSLCHSIPIKKLEKFINDCVNKYELFASDGEYFWSNTLLKRQKIRDELLSRLKEAGIKGAERRWGEGKEIKSSINFNPETNEWEGITEEHIKDWKKVNPNCDIRAELIKMKHWLIDNPRRRKKKYLKFITNWISRNRISINDSKEKDEFKKDSYVDFDKELGNK